MYWLNSVSDYHSAMEAGCDLELDPHPQSKLHDKAIARIKWGRIM